MRKTSLTACAVAVCFLTFSARVEAEGSLAAARELYASAAYDDALTMLDGLLSGADAREQRQPIELYRTLCLVAMGRTSEADRAIETMIGQDPLYRPSGDEMSPRVRSAFSDARKRLLPAIIQRQYAEAKGAFELQDFAAAAAGFTQVLDGLADPDITTVAAQPPLSDLRTLALGFHDLSAKSIAPPPAPVAAAPEPPPPAPQVRRLYSADDREVVPPVALRQKLPPFPGKVFFSGTGVLEFVIDETGRVQSATMRVPVNPQYDNVALAAARTWRYEPATLNGMPVKFLQRLQITLSPTP